MISRTETNKDLWLDNVARHAKLNAKIDADLETYLSAYWDLGYTSGETAKHLLTYLGVKQ